MKYLKPIDFIYFGMFSTLAIVFILLKDVISTVLLGLLMLHYFPLLYTLRKHGYMDNKDVVGIRATEKGIKLFYTLFLRPILLITNNVIVSTLLYLLAALVLLYAVFVVIVTLMPQI